MNQTSKALDMINKWEKPSREIVEKELGEGNYETFDYIFGLFREVNAKNRKCGHPCVSHSYDVAGRIKDDMEKYDFNDNYITTALLHDSGEEGSKNFNDLEKILNDINEKFGENIAKNVELLTNKYSILLRDIKIDPGKSFEEQKMCLLEGIKDKQADWAVKGVYSKKYEEYISKLKNIINSVTEGELEKAKKVYGGTTILHLVKFKCHEDYLKEIVEDVKTRFERGYPEADIGIVIKLYDGIDNIRKAPFMSMNDMITIINKKELRIDLFDNLIKWLDEKNYNSKNLKDLNLKLAYTLMMNIGTGKSMMTLPSDSQWNDLKIFYETEYSRICNKYHN